MFVDKLVVRFKTVHGNKYDYSLVSLGKNIKEVVILCSQHGEFKQKPIKHLSGNGCPKCTKLNNKLNSTLTTKLNNKLNSTLTTKDFIERAKLQHGDKFNYSLVSYVSCKLKVRIICNVHGEFAQSADNHLRGFGCSKCSSKYSPTTEEFVEKAKLVHGDMYDYSSVVYVTTRLKVKIICKKHGEFGQSAHTHLSGGGCVKCRDRFDLWSRSNYVAASEKYGGNANLYVIRCEKNGEVFYKIGITMVKIRTRFSGKQMPYGYDALYRIHGDAEKIWNLEKLIHRRLKHLQHTPKIPFGGQTECFSEFPEALEDYIARRAVPRIQLHD